jgi:hypothetical protein
MLFQHSAEHENESLSSDSDSASEAEKLSLLAEAKRLESERENLLERLEEIDARRRKRQSSKRKREKKAEREKNCEKYAAADWVAPTLQLPIEEAECWRPRPRPRPFPVPPAMPRSPRKTTVAECRRFIFPRDPQGPEAPDSVKRPISLCEINPIKKALSARNADRLNLDIEGLEQKRVAVSRERQRILGALLHARKAAGSPAITSGWLAAMEAAVDGRLEALSMELAHTTALILTLRRHLAATGESPREEAAAFSEVRAACL